MAVVTSDINPAVATQGYRVGMDERKEGASSPVNATMKGKAPDWLVGYYNAYGLRYDRASKEAEAIITDAE